MGRFSHIISERDDLIMRAVMRYVWPMWSGRKEALARAAYYVTEGHRRRRYWKCEKCGKKELETDQRQVDHIFPRTPVTGFDNINSWLERTLCDAEDLAILCLDCHKAKSAEEAGQRAEVRKAEKAKKAKRKATKKARKTTRGKK